MIGRKQWQRLNIKYIRKHHEELEEYDGYIPLYLTHFINTTNRHEHLTDKIIQQNKKYRKEYFKSDNKSEFIINDIIGWVNDNPQYNEIIIQKDKE